ncbi:interleukin-2 precursor [Cavia porcellus]|uniref:Interleukin-2 n=1 Tax=Cavia porcellus TaxID=10141 RepID=O88210_CAVPO|nr:interleukin-2 precursor [Cavia porcellus]BAA31346.1 interleukin 2 precursor [Cavia porcellus]
MYKTLLLSCLALTLALLTSSAPTSSSPKQTQDRLELLLRDLQTLLEGVTSNPRLPKMLKLKLYPPKMVSELQHLQCLEEELRAVEQVLNLAEHKNFPLIHTKDFISNINVTVLSLKGSETAFVCDLEDESVNIVEFLKRWTAFCQKIMSRLT